MSGQDRQRAPWIARYWWVPVIALLGGQIAVGVVTLRIAFGDKTFGTEPSYYEKAMAWDDERDARRDPAQLGWTMSITVTDTDDGEQKLTVALSENGEPVEQASITAEMFAAVRSNERRSVELAPTDEPGVYQVGFAPERGGMWEFRVGVNHGGERASRTISFELPKTEQGGGRAG
ncbi:MAG: FixH family protein [Planctomycetota bacterium]